MRGDAGMLLQGGLPFLSNPSTTTGANPTTLQQGPPLLPPGSVQGANPTHTWPLVLLARSAYADAAHTYQSGLQY